MSIVGHKTESTNRRYAIVDAESLRKAASKIDAMGTLTGTLAEKAAAEGAQEKVRKAGGTR